MLTLIIVFDVYSFQMFRARSTENTTKREKVVESITVINEIFVGKIITCCGTNNYFFRKSVVISVSANNRKRKPLQGFLRIHVVTFR